MGGRGGSPNWVAPQGICFPWSPQVHKSLGCSDTDAYSKFLVPVLIVAVY